jgi:hypothetical protein
MERQDLRAWIRIACEPIELGLAEPPLGGNPETRMPVYGRPSVSIPISSLIFGTSSALLGEERACFTQRLSHNWGPRETSRSFAHLPKCRRTKRSKPENCTGWSINTFPPNAKCSDLPTAARSNQSGKTKIRWGLRDAQDRELIKHVGAPKSGEWVSL